MKSSWRWPHHLQTQRASHAMETGLSTLRHQNDNRPIAKICNADEATSFADRSQVTRHTLAKMSAEVIPWTQFDSSLRDQLTALRSTRLEFRSPFFSLGFFDAVHAARGDVEAIVIRNHDRAVGILPIHRIGRVAVPVGRFLNDAHNVIAAPDTPVDWLWMLGTCKLRSFDFHALVGRKDEIPETSIMENIQSFEANIGTDSIAFLSLLESDHCTMRRQEQKTRKLEREIGPLTLELDSRDPKLISQAIDWKRRQYKLTNILDLFTPDWTRSLMRVLHEQPASPIRETATRGILSVLRAGDKVVAMHYGMIESGMLHYWFPSYDPQFARYSPGTALFKRIVRESTGAGIHSIDMGYGEQPYKRKQTDTVTMVSQGCVSSSGPYRTWRRVSHSMKEAVKRVPMKEPIKQVVRRLHPQAGISKLT